MIKKRPEIKYIGQRISYKTLRNSILDLKLSENDTIILNSKNFDNVVLEYRDEYSESMTFPHLLLGVLIRESKTESIPIDRIGILKKDEESIRDVNNGFQYYDGEVVHRCGWCGNIVDERGNDINGFERERAINYIENEESSIVKQIHGNCCPNGHD
jgi:hypothetical protein